MRSLLGPYLSWMTSVPYDRCFFTSGSRLLWSAGLTTWKPTM